MSARPCSRCGSYVCRCTAGPVFWRAYEALAHHALVEIRCDHEQGRDLPVCNCALVDLGWHPTVQAAKETWARHALAALGLDGDPLVWFMAATSPAGVVSATGHCPQAVPPENTPGAPGHTDTLRGSDDA